MKTWRVDDVMTTPVVSVGEDVRYREVVDLLVARRFSAVPVVDELGRVLGVVSEADLLRKIEYVGVTEPRLFDSRRRRAQRGKATAHTAAGLMSSPAVVALAGTSLVAAARLMDSAGVKRLPVVDDLGRLVGVVSRADLLKVHLRADDEILADVRSEVLTPCLGDDPATVQVTVRDGVVRLSGRVGRWSTSAAVNRLIRQVPGVVAVRGLVDYDYDDRDIAGTGLAVAGV
jgi:CBS domain-containing protein